MDQESYFVWRKGDFHKLSDHFATSEFQCPCHYPMCHDQKVAKDLVNRLELLRVEVGPLRITSGFRCGAHQTDLRINGYETADGLSQHEIGNASDLEASNFDSLGLWAPKYFKAVGISKRFIHVDIRDDKIRHWNYKK